MITVGNSDFNEFLERECAERAKERFKKKYLEKKKIPVLKRRRTLWEKLKEWRDGKRKDNL